MRSRSPTPEADDGLKRTRRSQEQDRKALTEERGIGYEIETTLADRRCRNHPRLRSLFVPGVKGPLGDRSPRPTGDREREA